MIAKRFRSVGMVACVTVAALGCYLVSQRVAAERAELARVERQIGATRKAVRQLATEIVTRSRMPQLERWNVAVLGLTAPGANQFLDSEIRLASLDAPKPVVTMDPAANPVQTVAYVAPARAEPLRVASAAAPLPAPAAPAAERPLLRQATFVRPAPGSLADPAAAPTVKVSAVRIAVDKPAAPLAAGSLLPADIGSLAAAERGQTRRK